MERRINVRENSPPTKQKHPYSRAQQAAAFACTFLLSFTSLPLSLLYGESFLIGGDFPSGIVATEIAEATPHTEQSSQRRKRGGRYRPAPADFSFAEDSTSEFADLELVEISEDSNIYYNPDTGEETEEIFSLPVRFEDEDGQLIDIDPSLEASERDDFAYESRAGPSTNFFPEVIDADTPFLLEREDYKIRFTLLKDSEVILSEIEDLEYTDIFSETEERPLAAIYEISEEKSFRVTSSDIGIKSEFILETVPETNIFTYELNLVGLSAELSSDHTEVILFCIENPEIAVAVIPEGIMWDASRDGAYSNDITYGLE